MTRRALFMAVLVLTLAAAGLSAGQLRAGATGVPACIVGRPCTATTVCGRLCFCLIAEGATSGSCQPNTIPQARDVHVTASR